MSENKARTADRVKGKNVHGRIVVLTRSKPEQLGLFQTFLPEEEEEKYSNTIELYDAVPKYFTNARAMASLRESGKYLPILDREFEHRGEVYNPTTPLSLALCFSALTMCKIRLVIAPLEPGHKGEALLNRIRM